MRGVPGQGQVRRQEHQEEGVREAAALQRTSKECEEKARPQEKEERGGPGGGTAADLEHATGEYPLVLHFTEIG